MSEDGWNTVLVLGGIRSGKSAFAESLLAAATGVRYVATAAPAGEADDPEWAARVAAHRDRRPPSWTTDEVGADPARLAATIAAAKPDDTLLVDDLGGWVAARLGAAGPDPRAADAGADAAVRELADAVRGCAGRLVLVSPEVGLCMVPTTPVGRAFADALGEVNQAVATACDAVVLVLAGQATWLKPSAAEMVAVAATERATTAPPAAEPATTAPPATAPPAAEPATTAPPAAEPAAEPATTAPPAPSPRPAPAGVPALAAPTFLPPAVGHLPAFEPAMELPMPGEEAVAAAHTRLARLDVTGAGMGELSRLVVFAAGAQSRPDPLPWRTPRLLLLHGDHAGGAAAGTLAGESARRAAQARSGTGPVALLAGQVGAQVQVIDAPAAEAMEERPALSVEAVQAALAYGWQLAADAVDDGADVLVIGACGAGTEAAAAAVLAATAGAEPAAVLPRVVAPGSRLDDNAWMLRCAAVRDALHRTRRGPRDAKDVLAELGGGDIAVATGVLLGATARRTPVLLDGPVGVAAALVSRDLAGQARHWCLLPDHGRSPLVKLAADVLGLNPFTDLRLDLGEGTTALASLPLLTAALTVAGELPEHPGLTAEPDATEPAADDDETPAPPDGA